MILQWLKNRRARKETAEGLYQAALMQSREASFYADYGVADTMDGRFDLLCLHVFLIVDRLEQFGPQGAKLAQAVFDRMFVNVSQTLREIGVGDLGVPKHMGRMMKAFNGRVHAYHDAIVSGQPAVLQLAVSRNVFRTTGEAIPAGVDVIVDYIMETHSLFAHEDLEDFKALRVRFPAVGMKRKEAMRA